MPVWWRIAPGAARRVDLGAHQSCPRSKPPAVTLTWWTKRPGSGLVVSVTCAAEPSEAITPWSPTWPPAIA